MREQHGKTDRPWEPERYQHEAQSPAAQLPAGDGMGFLLATVRRLAVRHFSAPYAQETRGAPPFDPAMMVCRWLSADCVGVFASRKSAVACARPLAFRAIVGQERPDFRPSSAFRTLPLEACKDVWGHGVRRAGEMGLGRLGNVAIDGTKMPGTASRHQARSYGDMPKAVERLREAMEAWVTQAEQQDAAEEAVRGSRRGDARPAEWARREERLVQREAALRRVETQAQADAQVERQRRAAADAERERTGNPRRGKAPPPVVEPPDAQAQRNLTEPELPSMRTHKKGWDSCGHAQARVDATCQMIVACDVPDASHDTQQAEPRAQTTLAILAQAGLERPQTEAGAAQALPATLDTGSDSEAAVEALERGGCDPSIATERQRHQTPQTEASAPPATAQERMAAKVRTPVGHAWYARRQVMVEPVLGQSKAGRGCRRLLRRGLANIRGAWRVGCLSHHRLKLWRYGCAPHTCSHEQGPSPEVAMVLGRVTDLLKRQLLVF